LSPAESPIIGCLVWTLLGGVEHSTILPSSSAASRFLGSLAY
jgi:hypothetical protein